MSRKCPSIAVRCDGMVSTSANYEKKKRRRIILITTPRACQLASNYATSSGFHLLPLLGVYVIVVFHYAVVKEELHIGSRGETPCMHDASHIVLRPDCPKLFFDFCVFCCASSERHCLD